jgi:outer membrane protein assembly factor BamD
MRKIGFIARYLFVGITLISMLNGCALYDRLFGEQRDKKPEELMTEGLASLKTGDYEAAFESFQAIKDRYPYSDLAIDAELKMAESLYERYEYDKAYTTYDEFEKFHPKDKNLPFVIYRKGMCHFEQIERIDTDQSHTLKAKEEFERLVKKFPRDDYANRARKNIRECLIFLAEYELNVGHFYFKKGNYKAALGRFTYLIQNYPDMGQYNEALEYISLCKEKLSEEAPVQ